MVASSPLRDDWTDATTDGDTPGSTHWSDTTPLKFDAELEHYDDAPDECTISPAAAGRYERLTTWISAQEGSYVDLLEMR